MKETTYASTRAPPLAMMLFHIHHILHSRQNDVKKDLSLESVWKRDLEWEATCLDSRTSIRLVRTILGAIACSCSSSTNVFYKCIIYCMHTSVNTLCLYMLRFLHLIAWNALYIYICIYIYTHTYIWIYIYLCIYTLYLFMQRLSHLIARNALDLRRVGI